MRLAAPPLRNKGVCSPHEPFGSPAELQQESLQVAGHRVDIDTRRAAIRGQGRAKPIEN